MTTVIESPRCLYARNPVAGLPWPRTVVVLEWPLCWRARLDIRRSAMKQRRATRWNRPSTKLKPLSHVTQLNRLDSAYSCAPCDGGACSSRCGRALASSAGDGRGSGLPTGARRLCLTTCASGD